MRRMHANGWLLAVMLAAAVFPTTMPAAPRAEAVGNPSGLLTGLTAYWKLDEASGTRVDVTGHGNDLTSVNTVAQASGQIGSAAGFTRNGNEYLTRADNADLSEGDNDFTIAGWFYLYSKPPQVWGQDTSSLIAKWGTGDRREYSLSYRSIRAPTDDVAADTFEFAASNDGTGPAVRRAVSTSLGPISINTWYFIVAWHDSSLNTLNIQVNNGAVDFIPLAGGVFDSNSPFEIGRMDDNAVGGRPDGRADEVGLWDRLLTPNERFELYNAGLGLTYPFDGSAGPLVRASHRFLPLATRNTGPAWQVIKQEGFEGAFPTNWQVTDYITTNGYHFWGARACQAASGSRSAWAVGDGDSILTCGDNYPNDTDTWLTYGPFSLADATAAQMNLQVNVYAEPGYDKVCYYASQDNLDYFGTCLSGNSQGWLSQTLDFAAVPIHGNMLGDDTVWVAIRFFSDEAANYPNGGFVDDVLIRKCTYLACPGAASQSPSVANEAVIMEPDRFARP